VKEAPAKRLWRPLKAWKAHEWVPMKNAWLRVHAALSENMRLTRRDLKAHLLAKRLVGAARVIAPDGSERCIIFEPAFWEPVDLPYAYLVSGYEKHASEGEAWHFFVRRANLDKHYPTAATAPASWTTNDRRIDNTARRRPGPQPKHDWPIEVAREVIRIVRAGKREPTARQLAQFCENQWGWQPDISAIQKLLKRLLS